MKRINKSKDKGGGKNALPAVQNPHAYFQRSGVRATQNRNDAGIGSKDRDFFLGLLQQIATANLKDGELDHDKLRMTVSYIASMKPQDPLHAMLALQTMAVHAHFMTFSEAWPVQFRSRAHHLRAAGHKPGAHVYQIEAHKRYGTVSEPSVKVQNVSVQDGGRAIVADLMQHTTSVALPDQAARAPLALPDSTAQEPRVSERKRQRVPRVQFEKDE